jgi:uncharacterized protein (TIGR03000 family)
MGPGVGVPYGPVTNGESKGKDEKGKDEKGKGDKDDKEISANQARLVVELPSDARLTIDDHPIPVTEGRRSFNTPALEKGQTYYYDVKVEVMRNGKPVTDKRKVLIRAGDVVREDFRSLGSATSTVSAGSQDR